MVFVTVEIFGVAGVLIIALRIIGIVIVLAIIFVVVVVVVVAVGGGGSGNSRRRWSIGIGGLPRL